MHNDFEVGQKDEYEVKGKDVGDLLMVKLINDGGGFLSDWFVNKVVIQKFSNIPGGVYNFPCFRWVSSELVLFEGKGITFLKYFGLSIPICIVTLNACTISSKICARSLLGII